MATQNPPSQHAAIQTTTFSLHPSPPTQILEFPTADSAIAYLSQRRQDLTTTMQQYHDAASASQPALMDQLRQKVLERLRYHEEFLRSERYARLAGTDVIYKGRLLRFASEEAAREFVERQRGQALEKVRLYREEVLRGDVEVLEAERLLVLAQARVQLKGLETGVGALRFGG